MKRFATTLVVVLALGACQPDAPDDEAVLSFEEGASATTPLLPEPPASVVIVLVDALRADWLGSYGSQRALTPELDRLADRSFVFENAWATSAWTRASIGSLFTARYPSSHTALTRDDALAPGNVTLAEALEAHGRFWSFGVTTNPNAGPALGFSQGFDHFDRPDPETARGYKHDAIRLIPAEAVTAYALELFDQRPDDDAHVFAFVHYVDPHDPYLPHPELTSDPATVEGIDGSRQALNELRKLGPDGGTRDNIASLQRLYDGEVRYTDQWIGELIRGFEARGVFDDMLFVVTADHGESFFEHGKRGHGQSLYETQLRVPLMIKLPGMQPGDGARLSQPISLVDVAPTVLHAFGVPRPEGFQGTTLGPVMFGEDRASAFDYVFAELQINPSAKRMALRHDDWKLIRNDLIRKNGREDRVWELYNLGADPGETDNQWSNPDTGEVAERLETALFQWEEAVARHAVDRQIKPLSELDEDTLEELRGLGYVQ